MATHLQPGHFQYVSGVGLPCHEPDGCPQVPGFVAQAFGISDPDSKAERKVEALQGTPMTCGGNFPEIFFSLLN